MWSMRSLPLGSGSTSTCSGTAAAGGACVSEAAAAAAGGLGFGRRVVAYCAAAAGGSTDTVTVAVRTPEQYDSLYGMSQDDLLQLLWEVGSGRRDGVVGMLAVLGDPNNTIWWTDGVAWRSWALARKAQPQYTWQPAG